MLAAQHGQGRPQQQRDQLGGGGQTHQHTADQPRSPAGWIRPGPTQHHEGRHHQPGRQHIDVRSVARLQHHQRAPTPAQRPGRIATPPAKHQPQQPGHEHRQQRSADLQTVRSPRPRRQPGDGGEPDLCHRRINGRHPRPVDLGPGIVLSQDVHLVRVRRQPIEGSDAAALGRRQPRKQQRVAQFGQPIVQRHVPVGRRPGQLHPAVPDIPVSVRAGLRRHQHSRHLTAGREQHHQGQPPPTRRSAGRDRGSQRQPGGDDEHPPEHQDGDPAAGVVQVAGVRKHGITDDAGRTSQQQRAFSAGSDPEIAVWAPSIASACPHDPTLPCPGPRGVGNRTRSTRR